MEDLATVDARDARVLIVDDDPQIGELLLTTLHFAGFVTETAGSGADALRQLDEFRPEVAVLDVLLPDIDGFEVVRRLREDGHQFPVLFLTACDSTVNKVKGLLLGGDDYVTKPFSVAEVIARVHALLRRSRLGGAEESTLRYADLRIDTEAHQVVRAGRTVDLSPTEYRLLRYLAENAGRVVSKTQILDRVWRYDFAGDVAVVERFICTLRRKIDFVDPPLVQTVRGFGYMLRSPAR